MSVEPVSANTSTGELSNIQLLREISSFLLDPEIAVSLFDDAPDPYIVINSKMKIELVNKQAERLLGYDRSELYDLPLSTLIQPENVLAPLSSFLEPSMCHNFSKSVIASAVPKDGPYFDVSLHFALIIAVQGTFVGITMRKAELANNDVKV